ncbi:FecR family protein [Chitinophaga sedimenti]|uniref:FecR family protein n=1 Tax=Chitinophaga sedimenti TaxID=2033606 RepID=UPI0020047A62|nr:FecR family protein [Chitinophaga sedimenti]MCK7555627.1 FecR family protein [Chitinophaga sedimenti]
MDTFHFHTLLHKFLSNEMTPDELSQFTAAVNTGDFDHLVQAAMLDHFQSQAHTWEPARQEAVLQDILQQVTPAPRVVRWRRLWAAAAVLLLGAGWGIYHFTVKPGTPAAETAVLADVPAGQQGAVLVLSNGQRVVLDSAGNGTVAAQAGANVVLNNGELAYEKADGSVDVAYNSIITPRGRQFSVTLPDGTKTWLNAGSSLRFPVTFAGKERRVELSGEAYFEVAANEAQPFKVSVNGKTEVLVLGTAFNINGYAEEAR